MTIDQRMETLRIGADATAHQLVGLTLALPRRRGPRRIRVLLLMRKTARLSWRLGRQIAALEASQAAMPVSIVLDPPQPPR